MHSSAFWNGFFRKLWKNFLACTCVTLIGLLLFSQKAMIDGSGTNRSGRIQYGRNSKHLWYKRMLSCIREWLLNWGGARSMKLWSNLQKCATSSTQHAIYDTTRTQGNSAVSGCDWLARGSVSKFGCRFNVNSTRNFDAVYDVRFERSALFGAFTFCWLKSENVVRT